VFVGDWALVQLWLFWLAPIVGAVVRGRGLPFDRQRKELILRNTALGAHADVGAGLSVGSRWSVALEVENLTNQQYLINLSSEFNGTHVAGPRLIGARLRFSF
jgi:hypothetical protein